jgi:hypothetical protein
LYTKTQTAQRIATIPTAITSHLREDAVMMPTLPAVSLYSNRFANQSASMLISR